VASVLVWATSQLVAFAALCVVMDERERFAAWYEREGERVLLFLARRTLDVELAVELTAETFALALGDWRLLRDLAPEQARAWLFTVAGRLYCRYLRRARVERRAVRRWGIQVPAVHEDDLALIEERAGLAGTRAALREELAQLSEDQREALRLRVVDQRPYPEVAAVLGVSEQAARARVSRGLRALSAALGPRLVEQEGLNV
jgi:RNA polymerase sigma factor (sigma-70 family)